MLSYKNHLNNPLFKTRYIDRNAWFVNMDSFFDESKKAIRTQITQSPLKSIYLAPTLLILSIAKKIYTSRYSKDIKRKIKRNPLKIVYLVPFYALSKIMCAKFWERKYPYWRIKCGKVDMPYFELVLTTRCTLRCESCNNLMQYFDSKNAYSCTFDGISAALDALFAVVDSIGRVRIIGGEPLLFKDIAKVVAKLDNEPKVKSFDIVTNGTIKFNDEILNALSESQKCSVCISDYSKSPNLTRKLYQREIIKSLKSRKIAYSFVFGSEDDRWFEPGKIYKRNRSKADIIRNFKSCLMPCVSVMSNESIPNANRGGGSSLKRVA